MSEIVKTDSGISYETAAPAPTWGAEEEATPSGYQPTYDGTADFNDPSGWMDIAPQRYEAEIVDERSTALRAEEASAYAQHSQNAGQKALGIGDAMNINALSGKLNAMWDDDSFSRYLDSDDDGYQSVQASPQLLAAVRQVYGVDEAEAKAFAYHHKLSPQQIAIIEQALTGSSTAPMEQRQEHANSTTKQGQEDAYDEDDESYQHVPQERVEADYIAEFRSLFPRANDSEWSAMLNNAINSFERMNDQQREYYDSPEGLQQLLQREMNKLERVPESAPSGKLSAEDVPAYSTMAAAGTAT